MKIHWIRAWQKFKPKWTFNRFGRQKSLLAFEFGVVLSEAASELKIDMNTEIVLRAEELLKKELCNLSPESFAQRMQLYTLAILEPKD